MISEIELDDENKKMTVRLTEEDDKSFNHLKGKLEIMYQSASLDQVSISCRTSFNSNSKRLFFTKDLPAALEFLLLHKACSKELKDEITTHLNNLSNKTTPSSSLSSNSGQ